MINPLILHKTQYPQGAPNKRLIIKFAIPVNVPGMEQYFKNLLSLFDAQTLIYRFGGEYKSSILNKINEIYYMSKSPNDFTDLMIHQKFIEFLSAIYLYRDKNRYSNRPMLSNRSAKIYNITSFIHDHFQEELSLDTLSKRFYISNYYLSHQFKKVTGFTLTKYIQMTRIRNAQTLLLSTKQSITMIAFQCGFTSFSQFNRVFDKIVHTSPSKFRKTGMLSGN